MVCLHFQLVHSKQDQYSEFNDTTLYNYTKTEIVAPCQYDAKEKAPIIISDAILNDYFSTKKTRKLITQVNEDGKTITTIEIWTTKHPSYLTWYNAALLGAVTTAAVGSGLLFYNNLYPMNHITQEESPELSNIKNESQNTLGPITSESVTQDTPTTAIENITEDIDTKDNKQSDQIKSPLFVQWVQLEFSGNQLSPEEIQQQHALEAQPEFKNQLKEFTQKMSNPIDFNAPDDKKCSLCTRLREAYGRTAEDNKTPHYFD